MYVPSLLKLPLIAPKKGKVKECSNYHTIALISHISKVMLQQYVNQELPDVQAGFRKGNGTRDRITNICWIIQKAREFQKTSTSASLTTLKLCGSQQFVGNSLRDGNTRPSPPASWEICMQVKKHQLESYMEQWTGSKLGKEYGRLYIVTLLI